MEVNQPNTSPIQEIPNLSQAPKSLFNWDKHFLPLSILVAAVFIAGAIIYTDSSSSEKIPTQGNISDIIIEDPSDLFDESDHVLGNKNAQVAIVEFSDFQCPFCRSFWSSTLPQLKKDYIDSGKVKLIYRDFPLSSIHPMAEPSAIATECAGEQGKFWQLHDAIFAEQNKKEPDPTRLSTVAYTESELRSWARSVGLDMTAYDSCVKSDKYIEEISGDASDGAGFGVKGTPAFFINGRYVNGAQPFAVFKQIIDEELNK